MRCTARNRQGTQCGNHAINGTSKCKLHGGASLMGVASPTFKTGRYSKDLPTRLAARYSEALADPQLLELRDEIALIGTRQSELLGHLDIGVSLERWAAAQIALGRLMAAVHAKDTSGLQAALIALEDALGAPVSDDGAVWENIVMLTEHRRRLVESEQKRLVAMQQMLSVEQTMTLIAQLAESIRKNVSDPTTLAAITAEFARIIRTDPNGSAVGG